MMEEGYLPFGSIFRQLAGQPVNLLLVHVVAVECVESNVALREAVILLAVHVEVFVEALSRLVMISQRRIKLHLLIQQRSIDILKFVLVVGRLFAAIEIVAQHKHKLEWKRLPRSQAKDPPTVVACRYLCLCRQ